MKKNNKKQLNHKKSNGKVASRVLVAVPTPAPVPVPSTPVVPNDVEQIAMTAEQSAKVRGLEQKVLYAKLQLADVGIQISDLQDQKTQLVNFIKNGRQEMMNEVRQVAESFGIDVEGVKDTRRWNLDTDQMVFRLVK